MPEVFFITSKEALIYTSIPHLRLQSANPQILSPYPEIIEFAKQKFIKVQRNSLELHRNIGIEICYVHKGHYNWVVGETNYTLYPGDAFITCPWELHGSPIGMLNRGCLSWIIISPEYFNEEGDLYISKNSGINKQTQNQIGKIFASKKSHIFKGKNIKEIFASLQQELFTPSLGSTCLVHQIIDHLLIETARNLQSADEKEEIDLEFNSFINKLETDFAESWDINSMAQLMNIHPLTLIKRCKQITGNTPIQLLTEIRIKQAKQKIVSTNLPITQIAYDCGFSSIQYFSKIFKRLSGYSPKEYREITANIAKR